MSYKRQLTLWLAALALLPLVAVSLAGAFTGASSIDLAQKDQLRRISNLAATAFEEIVGQRKEKLLILGSSWSMRDYLRNVESGDEDKVSLSSGTLRDSFLIQVDTLRTFDDLMMLDPTGRVVVAARPETVGMDLSREDYFQAVRNNHQYQYVFVSKAHDIPGDSKNQHARRVVLSMPFFGRRDHLLGVIAAFVDTDILAQFTNAISFGQTGIAFLIDSDNYLLYHPEPRFYQAYTSTPKLDHLIPRWEDGDIPGYGMLEDVLDGVRRVYHYQIIPELRIALCLQQDLSEYVRPQNGIRRNTLLAALLASALFVFPAAFLLTRRLTRPIDRIQDAMIQRLHPDAYPLLPPLGKGPFQRIAEGYNHLVHTLQKDREAMRDLQRQNDDLALHDPVTGLLNQSAFEQELGPSLWQGNLFGLIYLGFQDFPRKSCLLGGEAVDSVLNMTARRIAQSGLDFELPASLGGGNFVMIKRGAPDEVIRAAESFSAEMSRPFDLGEASLRLRVRAGIALFPDHGVTADALVSNANIAMLQAEAAGARPVILYQNEMRRQYDRQRMMLELLHNCAASEELFYMYQPILAGGKIAGFETLTRMKNPKLGLLSPEEFLPVAEADPVCQERLGLMALETACRFARRLRRDRGFEGYVSVNLNEAQLSKEDFVEQVGAMLKKHDLPPEAVRLEVSVQLLIKSSAAMRDQLSALRESGVKVMLDQILHLNSSFSQIWRMPIDAVKLSPSFFGQEEAHAQARAFVASFLTLLRGIGLEILAEGVDTAQEERLMEAFGFGLMQGNAKSLPLMEERAVSLLPL